VRESLRALPRNFAGARSVLVIAFGKAARPMAEAALAELKSLPLRGLLVPSADDPAPLPPLEVIPGGHPLPDEGSLQAGARALELCSGVGPKDGVLFLVSGGGSSMLEKPIDEEITLEELRTLHAALVRSGADIAAMNVIRKHCSAVKGGRLALAAAKAAGQLTLAVSDVPAGDLGALASGPSVADGSTPEMCRKLAAKLGLGPAFPRILRARLEKGLLQPTVARRNPCFERSEHRILLDNPRALERLHARALAAGLVAEVDATDGEPVADAAVRLLERLRELKGKHRGARVAILAGGEVSCPLPEQHGIGGRNQHFALHCALQIQGQPVAVLSAGTDGIDGGSPAAGALADGTTVQRGAALGRDATTALAAYDSFPFFSALGDALVTGRTGTNVRDLRVLVHD
jgi:hydroxypyruvate reductase